MFTVEPAGQGMGIVKSDPMPMDVAQKLAGMLSKIPMPGDAASAGAMPTYAQKPAGGAPMMGGGVPLGGGGGMPPFRPGG